MLKRSYVVHGQCSYCGALPRWMPKKVKIEKKWPGGESTYWVLKHYCTYCGFEFE